MNGHAVYDDQLKTKGELERVLATHEGPVRLTFHNPYAIDVVTALAAEFSFICTCMGVMGWVWGLAGCVCMEGLGPKARIIVGVSLPLLPRTSLLYVPHNCSFFKNIPVASPSSYLEDISDFCETTTLSLPVTPYFHAYDPKSAGALPKERWFCGRCELFNERCVCP